MKFIVALILFSKYLLNISTATWTCMDWNMKPNSTVSHPSVGWLECFKFHRLFRHFNCIGIYYLLLQTNFLCIAHSIEKPFNLSQFDDCCCAKNWNKRVAGESCSTASSLHLVSSIMSYWFFETPHQKVFLIFIFFIGFCNIAVKKCAKQIMLCVKKKRRVSGRMFNSSVAVRAWQLNCGHVCAKWVCGWGCVRSKSPCRKELEDSLLTPYMPCTFEFVLHFGDPREWWQYHHWPNYRCVAGSIRGWPSMQQTHCGMHDIDFLTYSDDHPSR